MANTIKCYFYLFIHLFILNYSLRTEENVNDHCSEDGNCEMETHNILHTDSHYIKDTLGNYEPHEDVNNEDDRPLNIQGPIRLSFIR